MGSVPEGTVRVSRHSRGPESGAFYVFDRRKEVWYWVDFEDGKFGGYTVNDFDQLVHECRFLDIVERLGSLEARKGWVVHAGLPPQWGPAANIEPVSK